MKALYFLQQFPESLLRPTVEFILALQCEDGRIPWQPGDKTDPWNHIEAAMGLSIGGEHDAAERAYLWLARQQLEDGSWYASYGANGSVIDNKRETNFVAYIATGVWHHYRVTGNLDFLQRFFPVVEKAMDFILRYQNIEGDVAWAVNPDGTARDDALVTASASIHKSLECALHICSELALDRPAWAEAMRLVRDALLNKPERFDRNWESKSRYSMDWFYPVLAGVYQGRAARDRIDARWDEFVREEMGCLCVNDEPWVTVAESCELTMALLSIGEKRRAANLYSWLHQFKHGDGGYWTGYVYRDEAIWPEEQTGWTAGAVLLAADALSGYTGASTLFTEHGLQRVEAVAARPRASREAAQ